ncbi:hypothetical protein C8J57DRAFT_1311998, partial [Mycena rebaudengoi]
LTNWTSRSWPASRLMAAFFTSSSSTGTHSVLMAIGWPTASFLGITSRASSKLMRRGLAAPFRQDSIRMVGIYKANRSIFTQEYQKWFNALVDELVALPIVKNHVLLYELLFPNCTSDVPLQGLGYPAPDVSAIIIVEYDLRRLGPMRQLQVLMFLLQQNINSERLAEIVRDREFLRTMEAANASGTLIIKEGEPSTVNSITKMYNEGV